MLGKLAKYLRIFGLDTLYSPKNINPEDYSTEAEPPFIFTRQQINQHKYGRLMHIKSDHVHEQLEEIKDLIKPYINRGNIMKRCIECNTPLIDTVREEVEQFVPEFVFHNNQRFKRCPACKKVYWQGSHSKHMMKCVNRMLDEKD